MTDAAGGFFSAIGGILGADVGPEEDFSEAKQPTSQDKARLLYDHCVASERNITESVHSLYIIGEHYSEEDPEEIISPETINGIPPFFKSLSAKEKAEFCYHQVVESLSREAYPVTVESLTATKRQDPTDPYSSFAGRFVKRVTRYVSVTLLILAGFYISYVFLGPFFRESTNLKVDPMVVNAAVWCPMGCIGALVHLLNHALTTTRLKTFELSEERKIWPRILLGSLFGFVLPWVLSGSLMPDLRSEPAAGSIFAFFGGYSVRFSIGLLERVLSAIVPETRGKS